MRHFLLLPAALLALALPPAASASRAVRYGLMDDAWLTAGPGPLEQRLQTVDDLGAQVVRFTLHWNAIAASGPNQSGWDWTASDAVLAGLRAHGIQPVLTLLGTPRWANGGRAPNWAPRRAASFAAFARAAAERYSWVRDWTIWNEPNQPITLRPTKARLYVRRLLNPAYAAIHAVIPHAQVAGGVTAPRANRAGVSPLAWIGGMRAAHAHLDVYAHHPYPGSPRETPFAGGCGNCDAITMANLPVLLHAVAKAFPGRHVWLTEYGYQTNPPDAFFGVSPRRQALLLGEAALRAYELPRVDMLIHFLYRDEHAIGAWQSGLVTLHYHSKPALGAFARPLAQAGRNVLWGQVRPGSGRRRYRLQRLVHGHARRLGSLRRTDARGFLRRRVRLRPGERVRIWTPDGTGAWITAA